VLIGIDASRATAGRRTGTETYSLQLIRALARLRGERDDFAMRLYVNGPPPEGLFWSGPASAGCEIRSIPWPRLWTHVRLSAEVTAHPPDVLFVPAHVLPLAHPARSVATVHDLGYLTFPEAHRSSDRRYLDWSTAWNARQSRAVIADSAATRDDLVQAYGIAPEKIHVIYLGANPDVAVEPDPQRRAAARERYGIGERYLLYVGTLQPRKNLARVVQAFAGLAGRESFEGVQLVLAGKRGWLDDDLFMQVRALGLEGRVLFPGYVADADLAPLLSGALGFVFPSLYEGFGMPVLEAQACGAAVMTSNNSSLPEVAGDAALLVDPGDVDAIADAMQRLVTDEALRAALVARGFENVKRFSWEKCARETLAVLESVARKRR
jgi:glycosyltransferase involved in cell wall biosynthesis